MKYLIAYYSKTGNTKKVALDLAKKLKADVDEIIVTDFILNMDQRFLCSQDCKGLCEKCGADLNNGPCSCKLNTDPRFAVLGQLLENK